MTVQRNIRVLLWLPVLVLLYSVTAHAGEPATKPSGTAAVSPKLRKLVLLDGRLYGVGRLRGQEYCRFIDMPVADPNRAVSLIIMGQKTPPSWNFLNNGVLYWMWDGTMGGNPVLVRTPLSDLLKKVRKLRAGKKDALTFKSSLARTGKADVPALGIIGAVFHQQIRIGTKGGYRSLWGEAGTFDAWGRPAWKVFFDFHIEKDTKSPAWYILPKSILRVWQVSTSGESREWSKTEEYKCDIGGPFRVLSGKSPIIIDSKGGLFQIAESKIMRIGKVRLPGDSATGETPPATTRPTKEPTPKKPGTSESQPSRQATTRSAAIGSIFFLEDRKTGKIAFFSWKDGKLTCLEFDGEAKYKTLFTSSAAVSAEVKSAVKAMACIIAYQDEEQPSRDESKR